MEVTLTPTQFSEYTQALYARVKSERPGSEYHQAARQAIAQATNATTERGEITIRPYRSTLAVVADALDAVD